MARLWILTQLLLVCFAASFLASESNVMRAAPHSPRVAGVFMLIEGGKYTLNFTSARAACLLLNVTIATKNQMERALQRGLEMCKYGWIAEQIGAIPRIISDNNCGRGKIGLVLWSASPDKAFGVFCFNASADSEETQSTTKAVPRTFTSPTMLTSLTQTPTPTTPMVKSTTRAPSSRKPKTTKSPEQTSAFALLVKTIPSTRMSSTSTSHDSFSTHIPTSLSHLISSKPTVDTVAQSESSAKTSLGVVPTALIILGLILLLLAAAGATWYYKLNTSCCPGQQKDDIETEMWKHTDSELDLRSQHGAEDGDGYEEPDKKYSSDITLCVNPDIKNQMHGQ
ncbi:lymphatic vessel endothelial hyaluronic receptor 1b isoform X1 [Pleuronectes platessa]|uniref:lymphatic vessel endothelial hyaluronic receptor 1b isoform X1 n=1 Tax=Pleuronectes platessa TaxID=8262 RepID=UPI00232A2AFF|nr:lymphatic vessel endothelial hyaluronic receptor 1b isoform X1 [Pleuronectes platessa]